MDKPFKFLNPGKVKLLSTRVVEQNQYVDTSTNKWKWEDGGYRFKIDWDDFVFSEELLQLLKAFIFHRLEVNAPISVGHMDKRMLKFLSSSKLSKSFPWTENSIRTFLLSASENVSYHRHIFYSFLRLYEFAIKRMLPGFNNSIFNLLKEIKPFKSNSLEHIYLRQNVITTADEAVLLKHIEKSFRDDDLIKCRDNVILHIGYELAPRPIQIHSIDEKDFNIFSNEKTRFFSLSLPMAKKQQAGPPEKRLRSISNGLGEKIEKLIKLNRFYFPRSYGLFLDLDGERLRSVTISTIVSASLKEIGFTKGDSLTLLRHHLAQSLADQGAPAEVIAELLGHNSTVAARAYIGATPEISTIKTRALGKNGTYLKIMKMMITGEIIEKEDTPKDRWIKGMVGSQYIGGIGSCGLSSNTSCPKNPVYSCYTCSKFHPFIDGTHAEVKTALETQSQYFLDMAERGIQIESNRALTQLEMTIQAVDGVIEKCQNISKKTA
jgi:site-specific recombinase XerD